MRCSPTDGTGTAENEIVSVIGGDLFFGTPDAPERADLQKFAFRDAIKRISAIRDSSEELGNAIVMFDQAGPWKDFFSGAGRKQAKGRLNIAQLKPEFKDGLMDLLISFGLPPSLTTGVEAIPEEKLKFLFLNLAERMKLPLRTLLEENLIAPKSSSLVRGEVATNKPDVEDAEFSEDDEVYGTEFSSASCSVEFSGPSQLGRIRGTSFSDFVARCRGVAASLTVRAATLPDMSQVGLVEAFYQMDLNARQRVDANVVTFGAEFAQRELGLLTPVKTRFYVPIKDGYGVTTYWTEGGETEKRESAISWDGLVETIKS